MSGDPFNLNPQAVAASLLPRAERAEAELARLHAELEGMPDRMAEAWGGNAAWFTTGNKVAEVVRDWLREAMAGGTE